MNISDNRQVLVDQFCVRWKCSNDPSQLRLVTDIDLNKFDRDVPTNYWYPKAPKSWKTNPIFLGATFGALSIPILLGGGIGLVGAFGAISIAAPLQGLAGATIGALVGSSLQKPVSDNKAKTTIKDKAKVMLQRFSNTAAGKYLTECWNKSIEVSVAANDQQDDTDEIVEETIEVEPKPRPRLSYTFMPDGIDPSLVDTPNQKKVYVGTLSS